MSSKIEVCKTCNGTGIEYDGAGHTCTTCNGIAAPVVERQPIGQATYIGGDYIRLGLHRIGDLKLNDLVYTAPPELAELQATIDRLTAENERLKGGHGEQLDMAVSALNDIVKVSRMGEKPFEIATLAIGEMSAIASQPAPVAVVINERKAFERWWRANMNIKEMALHRNVYPMHSGWSYACHETNRSWKAWGARAGLDKVKELNQ